MTVTLAEIYRERGKRRKRVRFSREKTRIASRAGRLGSAGSASFSPPAAIKDVSTTGKKLKRDRRSGEAFYITALITYRIHVGRKIATRINRLIERGLRRASLPPRGVITDSRDCEMAPIARSRPPPASDDPGRSEKIARRNNDDPFNQLARNRVATRPRTKTTRRPQKMPRSVPRPRILII